jgi:hypothetical protein
LQKEWGSAMFVEWIAAVRWYVKGKPTKLLIIDLPERKKKRAFVLPRTNVHVQRVRMCVQQSRTLKFRLSSGETKDVVVVVVVVIMMMLRVLCSGKKWDRDRSKINQRGKDVE